MGIMRYNTIMRKISTTQQKKIIKMKHDALVRSFLVYNYAKKSQQDKDIYFEKVKPQIISRTMRLEGEWVSEDDVKRIISGK